MDDIIYKTIELIDSEIVVQNEILISDKETEIEPFNFVDCTELVNVVIPDTISDIGAGAFWGCTGLVHIEVPDNISFVDECAFKDCTNLARVKWSSKLDYVAEATFSYCSNLKEFDSLPLYMICDRAFEYCTSLEEIDLSFTEYIRDYAFVGCDNLKNVIFKETGVDIRKNAFFGCASLHSIEIPANSDVWGSAFANCTGLEYATIGNTFFNEIAFGLFMGCTSLKEVTIHRGIKRIYANAFADCIALKTIYYMGTREEWENDVYKADGWNDNVHPDFVVVCIDDKTRWNYINGNVYEDVVEGTFHYDEHNTQCVSIEFGCSVTNIGPRSMHNCYNIRELYLPKYVKTISYFAMLNCINLGDIYYEGTIEDWNKIEKHTTTVTSIIDSDNTVYYPDWREGVAENDTLRGKFVVHCLDGDVTYDNNEFYIICVDEAGNFLYIEEHHAPVYKTPEIDIDGYEFTGSILYNKVMYLNYAKTTGDNIEDSEASTKDEDFLEEDEVIVAPSTNTSGMTDTQITQNSLMSRVCIVYFDEELNKYKKESSDEWEVTYNTRLSGGEARGNFRLVSELAFYKIYNEATKKYRYFCREYVRYDDTGAIYKIYDCKWNVSGNIVRLVNNDTGNTGRTFTVEKVYDNYMKVFRSSHTKLVKYALLKIRIPRPL